MKGIYMEEKDKIIFGNTEESRFPTDEEIALLLKDNPNISAAGANEFKFGFSPENLDNHWTGGDSDHSREYLSYTKEQYAKEALDLVQSAVNDTILGYKNKYGQVIRYDRIKNNFVVGHPDIGIATMFKPPDRREYFDRQKLRGKISE